MKKICGPEMIMDVENEYEEIEDNPNHKTYKKKKKMKTHILTEDNKAWVIHTNKPGKIIRKKSKSNTKYSLFIFLGVMIALMLILPVCYADLGTFKINSCVPIRILSNCSSVNLIEVTSPNQTFNISDSMIRISGQTFFYTFCNTSQNGIYSFSWSPSCQDCSNINCGNSFSITATGYNLDTAKSVTYILIFVISFLIFLGLLIIGIALPISNKKDEMTGFVLEVSNLKYLKLLCLAFAYLAAMFISYFSYIICFSYLDLNFMTSIFYFIFISLLVCIFPFFVVGVYFAISNTIRDSGLKDSLSRGLHVK